MSPAPSPLPFTARPPSSPALPPSYKDAPQSLRAPTHPSRRRPRASCHRQAWRADRRRARPSRASQPAGARAAPPPSSSASNAAPPACAASSWRAHVVRGGPQLGAHLVRARGRVAGVAPTSRALGEARRERADLAEPRRRGIADARVGAPPSRARRARTRSTSASKIAWSCTRPRVGCGLAVVVVVRERADVERPPGTPACSPRRGGRPPRSPSSTASRERRRLCALPSRPKLRRARVWRLAREHGVPRAQRARRRAHRTRRTAARRACARVRAPRARGGARGGGRGSGSPAPGAPSGMCSGGGRPMSSSKPPYKSSASSSSPVRAAPALPPGMPGSVPSGDARAAAEGASAASSSANSSNDASEYSEPGESGGAPARATSPASSSPGGGGAVAAASSHSDCAGRGARALGPRARAVVRVARVTRRVLQQPLEDRVGHVLDVGLVGGRAGRERVLDMVERALSASSSLSSSSCVCASAARARRGLPAASSSTRTISPGGNSTARRFGRVRRTVVGALQQQSVELLVVICRRRRLRLRAAPQARVRRERGPPAARRRGARAARGARSRPTRRASSARAAAACRSAARDRRHARRRRAARQALRGQTPRRRIRSETRAPRRTGGVSIWSASPAATDLECQRRR